MAEAKGINPQITTPEEVKEGVKEVTAEVVEKAPSLASSENYTLYAMAVVLLLALIFLAIGLIGNPLSYAPVPYSALY